MEIYKITNNITKEFYIGLNSTSNPDYYGSGVKIKQQIDKYGKENFIKEILCVLTSNFNKDKNVLRKIEHIYISAYIKDKQCLNKSIGYTKGINNPIYHTYDADTVLSSNKEIEILKIKLQLKENELQELKNKELQRINFERKKASLGRGLSRLLKDIN